MKMLSSLDPDVQAPIVRDQHEVGMGSSGCHRQHPPPTQVAKWSSAPSHHPRDTVPIALAGFWGFPCCHLPFLFQWPQIALHLTCSQNMQTWSLYQKQLITTNCIFQEKVTVTLILLNPRAMVSQTVSVGNDCRDKDQSLGIWREMPWLTPGSVDKKWSNFSKMVYCFIFPFIYGHSSSSMSLPSPNTVSLFSPL